MTMRKPNNTAAFVRRLRSRAGTPPEATPWGERDFAGQGRTAAFVRRLRAFGAAGV